MFSHSTWKCNRGHVESSITTDVKNDGHKPRDVVSIRELPHWQLSAIRQMRSHSDTAADFFTCLKIIQSSLLLSFCWKFFCRSVSSKTFKLIQVLKNKMWFSLHRPILLIVFGCCRALLWNKISYYPLLSKLISYSPEDWRFFVDSLYQQLVILTNICWSYLKI